MAGDDGRTTQAGMSQIYAHIYASRRCTIFHEQQTVWYRCRTTGIRRKTVARPFVNRSPGHQSHNDSSSFQAHSLTVQTDLHQTAAYISLTSAFAGTLLPLDPTQMQTDKYVLRKRKQHIFLFESAKHNCIKAHKHFVMKAQIGTKVCAFVT